MIMNYFDYFKELNELNEDCELLEAKADQEKFYKWLTNDMEEDKAETLLSTFVRLKQRIKSPYNDFYWWMKNSTPDVFDEYIKNLESNVKTIQQNKDKAKEGAKLIYEDDDWYVYNITNFEASKKYGAHTKWCITGKNLQGEDTYGNRYWDEYTDKGIQFYFYINKKDNKKYALAYAGDGHCEIYNEEDNQIARVPNGPHIEGIPDEGTRFVIMVKRFKEAGMFDNDIVHVTMRNNPFWAFDEYDFWDATLDDGTHRYFATCNDYARDETELFSDCMEVPETDDPLSKDYLDLLFKKYDGNFNSILGDVGFFVESIKWEYDRSLLDGVITQYMRDNPKDKSYWDMYEVLWDASQDLDFNLDYNTSDWHKEYERAQKFLHKNDIQYTGNQIDDVANAINQAHDHLHLSYSELTPKDVSLFLDYHYREMNDIDTVIQDMLDQASDNEHTFVDEYESLHESKADMARFKEWCDNFSDNLYDRFIKQKERLEQKDIYYWMKKAPEQLNKALIDLEHTPTNRENRMSAQEGAELIHDQDGWKVYKINTYKASNLYGKGTTWCISGDEDGCEYFDDYKVDGIGIYFYIPESTWEGEKYALILRNNGTYTIYNAEDDIIPRIPNAPKVKGLPDVSVPSNDLFHEVEVALPKGSKVSSIMEISNGDIIEFYFDYDTREAYEVILSDGSKAYVHRDSWSGQFEDDTKEVEEFKKEYNIKDEY